MGGPESHLGFASAELVAGHLGQSSEHKQAFLETRTVMRLVEAAVEVKTERSGRTQESRGLGTPSAWHSKAVQRERQSKGERRIGGEREIWRGTNILELRRTQHPEASQLEQGPGVDVLEEVVIQISECCVWEMVEVIAVEHQKLHLLQPSQRSLTFLKSDFEGVLSQSLRATLGHQAQDLHQSSASTESQSPAPPIKSTLPSDVFSKNDLPVARAYLDLTNASDRDVHSDKQAADS
ncbi:hypothetical protein EYF80_033830 [Liparis tanakae]|uniref:Uncharacterized protein n=1 Tax=Liparis tanakae TaxID=230148 RepID=A0A4Z2GT18_9TELE|nr:hypothetical protein EYF80_033830 [Liparis tanakae]